MAVVFFSSSTRNKKKEERDTLDFDFKNKNIHRVYCVCALFAYISSTYK